MTSVEAAAVPAMGAPRGLVAVVVAAAACGPPSAGERGEPPPAPAEVFVDSAETRRGVPSVRDHAVVALDGGDRQCTGVLVAEDLVLTARHCLAEAERTVSCPAAERQIHRAVSAGGVRVFAGYDLGSARLLGLGAAIVAPAVDVLCDHDIAFLVLDRAAEGVEPLPVENQGIARGDFVRLLGFGRPEGQGGRAIRLEREHVRVRVTQGQEFIVGAPSCDGDSGGPALSERTGGVVGILSRGTRGCAEGSAENVYTRADAFLALQAEAEREALRLRADRGELRPPRKAPPKPRPTTSVGAPCTAGDECPTLVCLTQGPRSYCSRRCGPGDRCPAGYRCRETAPGEAVCVARES